VDEGKPSRWQRLQKLSFNRKALIRRMRRVESVTVRHARKFIVHRLDNVREVRRHIIMWVLAVGILIGTSGLQLMWYNNNYQALAKTNNGTYAEAVLGPVNTLNPLFAGDSAEQAASQLLFSRLFTYDTTGHLSNDLASSISINNTGKVYTITIRSDAHFSDGVAVTSKDVSFTLGLLGNPAVHSTITGWNNVKIGTPTDTTITFTLPAIYAAFPDALTFPILPEHVLGKVSPNVLRENNFSNNPIGSGPFRLRFVQDINSTDGQEIIDMQRNTNYYKGSPKLERFQLNVYDSHNAILGALNSGEVNAAADLTGTDVAQLNQTRYNIRTSPIESGVYAILNTTRSILADKAVRQALQIGTDTVAIRHQLPTGAPTLDLPFINGQLTGSVPSAPTYNKTAAEKLLDDAGWKLNGNIREKNSVRLKLNVVTTKDNDYGQVLQVLAGQWRSLGIEIDTQVIDPNDVTQGLVQNVLEPRNYDVLLYQLTIGSDPDVYAYWDSSQIGSQGLNFSNYNNAISDDALASARSRLEPDLRNSKYLTFARQWLSDVPAIGLYQSTMHYVYSKNAATYNSANKLISTLDRYDDILYWSVGTHTVFKTR
jgi:peptide/nickel transport system substrate-binding protein